jgi:phosphonate transport system permease protein
MASAVVVLPDTQLAALKAAHRKAALEKRVKLGLGVAVALVLLALSWKQAEIDPQTFFGKIDRFFDYFNRLTLLDSGQRVWTDPAEWFWALKRNIRLIGETVLMAYVGTMTGFCGAFALSFLASPNLTTNRWTVFFARRGLEFFRTVPDLVFALMFVAAFGLGPLPGVLAIALHTAGALGKQFFETTENIDSKPVEGLRSVGASYVQMVRFAAVPQVLASYASFALLRFEINVREATILGFVGAGGIGQDLLEAIRKFYYSDTSAILVLIIALVTTIDISTQYLRAALTGEGKRR